MTTYRIVCKLLSSDSNHIQTVGITDDPSKDKATDSASPKKIIRVMIPRYFFSINVLIHYLLCFKPRLIIHLVY